MAFENKPRLAGRIALVTGGGRGIGHELTMGRTVIRTDALMRPIAHFSHGLRVGDEIHLGAAAGTDAKRRLAGSPPGLTDARAQADQMYRNMKLALELLGGGIEDVVRLKTYLTDWRDLAACEEVYGEHWRLPYPSRSTVATWGFPLPFAVIEAELTAVVGRSAGTHYTVVGGEDGKETLSRLASLLEEAGLKIADVVKLTVTLADLRDYPVFEETFAQFFKPPYPARTVSVAPLSEPTRRVEIESVALAGGGKPIEGRGLFRSPGAASPAMRAGAHLYLSAQPGIDENDRVVAGVEAQARAAWRRIYAILEEAGMDASDVVPYPPRATVIGGLLEPQALVQIEALAHREGRNATVLECNE